MLTTYSSIPTANMGSFLSKLASAIKRKLPFFSKARMAPQPVSILREPADSFSRKLRAFGQRQYVRWAEDLPKPDAPVFFEGRGKGVKGLMLHANPTLTW
jgi:hypothetical protein